MVDNVVPTLSSYGSFEVLVDPCVNSLDPREVNVELIEFVVLLTE